MLDIPFNHRLLCASGGLTSGVCQVATQAVQQVVHNPLLGTSLMTSAMARTVDRS